MNFAKRVLFLLMRFPGHELRFCFIVFSSFLLLINKKPFAETGANIVSVIIMSNSSIEALAMAGVDYNEWGMEFEEWERMEMGPPPPHLFAEDYEEDERVEGGVSMLTSIVDELCGAVENQLEDVFDDHDMSEDGEDEFQIPLPKYYNKIVKGGDEDSISSPSPIIDVAGTLIMLNGLKLINVPSSFSTPHYLRKPWQISSVSQQHVKFGKILKLLITMTVKSVCKHSKTPYDNFKKDPQQFLNLVENSKPYITNSLQLVIQLLSLTKLIGSCVVSGFPLKPPPPHIEKSNRAHHFVSFLPNLKAMSFLLQQYIAHLFLLLLL
ncbi:unnamed protein product [Lactuca saligna]|uniref:Uncharacterized protein n=1 Tax=Lactuca saligna TaxID=75948 RepID=A0AA35VN21_LACSI|nr:unnamed protein product [Lactuca saligna]